MALALLEAGRSVRVLEPKTADCVISHGNCGTITPSHAAPLTAPGNVAKALHWMLTPDAPFYVKTRYDPGLWSWMLRFAAHSNAIDWRAAITPRRAIPPTATATLASWVASYALQYEIADPGAVSRVHAQRDADHPHT